MRQVKWSGQGHLRQIRSERPAGKFAPMVHCSSRLLLSLRLGKITEPAFLKRSPELLTRMKRLAVTAKRMNAHVNTGQNSLGDHGGCEGVRSKCRAYAENCAGRVSAVASTGLVICKQIQTQTIGKLQNVTRPKITRK